MTSVVRIKRQGGRIVQDCDIYIGRACNMGGWNLSQSKWHNPYRIKDYSDINEVLRLYENYIRASPLIDQLEELRGKRLGCWCKPGPCHGDILVKLLAEKKRIQ